ncbi:MAG: hypothetical protein D6762_04205 [Candidatus Neomarinimicrobiota bacterium]|nr:MAG: hypothetical protein D6762_04205 [Candidatus Neomarinimicrobiota bacterium]
MNRFLPILLLVWGVLVQAQPPKTPAQYWASLSKKEKITFVNGAYAMASRLKSIHQEQVNYEFSHDPNFREPYFVERFYEIIDEHIATEIGYHLSIITEHMDALYANSDNARIPLMEAIHIVSLAQDGNQDKANLLLLQAQRKYPPFPNK